MSPGENEAVVRRFWNELIVGGNVDVAPELLTPDYVNLIVERIGGDDVSTGPARIDPTRNGVDHLMAAIKEWHEVVESASFDVVSLAATDDAVFARFNMTTNMRDGSTARSRGIGYYHLTNGRIDLNDVLTVAV